MNSGGRVSGDCCGGFDREALLERGDRLEVQRDGRDGGIEGKDDIAAGSPHDLDVDREALELGA
jgi:hypothetical protein